VSALGLASSSAPKRCSVNRPSITYSPRRDVTPEEEASALANVYRLILDSAQKRGEPREVLADAHRDPRDRKVILPGSPS
jgi:hypothetical protein